MDGAVEIPMVGHGHSLNVAVAGSLVLYKLAGLLYPPLALPACRLCLRRSCTFCPGKPHEMGE